MNRKLFIVARLPAAAMALVASLVTGCSTKPVSPQKIEAAQIERRPAAPVRLFGDMDHALACLGDRLRDQKTQPLLIGYGAVADTTGKTGVDFVAATRSELAKIIARGSTLRGSSQGIGPRPRVDVLSAEEGDVSSDTNRRGRLARADWTFSGGAVSVTNAFISLQKSAGLSGRDVDFATSGTASVELVSMSFGFKYTESGVDIPGLTADVRVSYQSASDAREAGLFAQGSVNGKRYAAGLRLGRTSAWSQVPEDAIRAGIAFALMQLLSARFGVDASACAAQPLTPDHLLPKAEQPNPADLKSLPARAAPATRTSDLPGIWKKLDDAGRVRWFQHVLAVRGYGPGPASGQLDAATRQALTRAAQDYMLPANGLPAETLFYVLGMAEIAFGRDPRRPEPTGPAPAARNVPAVHVHLSQPNAPYRTGTDLRASVVTTHAGWLNCWLLTPVGPMSLYPILPMRSHHVAAHTPVLLPDTNVSGRHPSVSVNMPGPHEVVCLQARRPITARLPEELRPGVLGESYADPAQLRAAIRTAAGADFIAEGSVTFDVVEPPARAAAAAPGPDTTTQRPR